MGRDIENYKKWKEDNKEKRKQYAKEYREANKERVKEKDKQYYEEHKEEYLQWRKKHLDNKRRYDKQYRKEKPFKVISHQCNKLIKKYPNIGLVTPEQIEDIYNKQNGKCAILGKEYSLEELSLDHIIPVSNNGTNHISNLRFIHWRLNLFKLDSTEEEFISDLNELVDLMIIKRQLSLLS